MSILCCCCRRNKDTDPLVIDPKRSESKIIASRTKSDRHSSNETDRISQYEPPIEPSELRLSLPTAPAQKEANVITAKTLTSAGNHIQKMGYVKKKGHLVKNWKRRYLVLKDGVLTYYASAAPASKRGTENQDGQGKKGYVTLEGAKIEEFSDNSCRLLILTQVEEKGLLIEAETAQEATEWRMALSDAIRAGNIHSLSMGQRVPQVVQWYMEEHWCYDEAMKVLEFGHVFKLHYIDAAGITHLFRIWLQAMSNSMGLVFFISPDGMSAPSVKARRASATSTNAKNTTAKKFDGLEVLFQDISSITKGTTENVFKTKDMGPDSAFFTMKTADTTYVMEVESRTKRDQWALAIRDVVNFIHIPKPGLRRGGGGSAISSNSSKFRSSTDMNRTNSM